MPIFDNYGYQEVTKNQIFQGVHFRTQAVRF